MNAAKALAALIKQEDPATPIDWVSSWFELNEYTINARREVLGPDASERLSDILTRLHYEYQTYTSDRRKILIEAALEASKGSNRPPAVVHYKGFSRQYLDDATVVFMKQQSTAALDIIKAALQYNPAAGQPAALETWLTALTGEPTELDIAVLKHILWQTKRKLFGKKSKWELILNFRGKQGVGKTVSVRKLAEPIRDIFLERKISEMVGDTRSLYVLNNTYLMLFEELEKADKVEIEGLKSLMSKDKINWRILGKNADDTGKNNCTFISTSNKSLADFFFDPTGMRRFYEINVADTIDQETINSIDYLSIWQSIDENQDVSPIEPFLTQLFAFQETNLRQKSSVEYFIQEARLIAEPFKEGDRSNRVPVRKLYQEYREMCDSAGFRAPVSEPVFSRQMREFGFGYKITSTASVLCLRRSSVTQVPHLKTVSLEEKKDETVS